MNTELNTPPHNHLNYAAYMIRVWQETPDGPWRASAQSVQNGEVVRFGSLQRLFAFLETESRNSAGLVNQE